LGRKTGASLKAINRAIVDTGCNRSHPLPSGGPHQEDIHRLAPRGYVGWNRRSTPTIAFNTPMIAFNTHRLPSTPMIAINPNDCL
jgi:hypothetical protein